MEKELGRRAVTEIIPVSLMLARLVQMSLPPRKALSTGFLGDAQKKPKNCMHYERYRPVSDIGQKLK